MESISGDLAHLSNPPSPDVGAETTSCEGVESALADVSAQRLREEVTARSAQLGLSRQALALRAGVGRSSLFAWFAGSASPTAGAFAALSQALEVDPVTLLLAAGGAEPGPVTAARLRKGWSRSQLARRARVSGATVALVESGGSVRSDAAARVARALGAPALLRSAMAAPTPSRTMLGSWLETTRRRRGWTVAKLGVELGVSRQMASAWLHGTEPVAAGRLGDVAALLRLPPEQVEEAAMADRALGRPAAPAGRALRQARTGAGMTQGELARRVGVSTSSVEHWEMGLRAPGGPMRERLASVLGVPESAFDIAA